MQHKTWRNNGHEEDSKETIQKVHSFMGLGASGPTSSCRIGPAVPSIDLRQVTCVIECSDDAVKAWESAPWQS